MLSQYPRRKLSHVSLFIHCQQGAVLLREVGVDQENGIGEWLSGMDKKNGNGLGGMGKGNGVRPVGLRKGLAYSLWLSARLSRFVAHVHFVDAISAALPG